MFTSTDEVSDSPTQHADENFGLWETWLTGDDADSLKALANAHDAPSLLRTKAVLKLRFELEKYFPVPHWCPDDQAAVEIIVCRRNSSSRRSDEGEYLNDWLLEMTRECDNYPVPNRTAFANAVIQKLVGSHDDIKRMKAAAIRTELLDETSLKAARRLRASELVGAMLDSSQFAGRGLIGTAATKQPDGYHFYDVTDLHPDNLEPALELNPPKLDVYLCRAIVRTLEAKESRRPGSLLKKVQEVDWEPFIRQTQGDKGKAHCVATVVSALRGLGEFDTAQSLMTTIEFVTGEAFIPSSNMTAAPPGELAKIAQIVAGSITRSSIESIIDPYGSALRSDAAQALASTIEESTIPGLTGTPRSDEAIEAAELVAQALISIGANAPYRCVKSGVYNLHHLLRAVMKNFHLHNNPLAEPLLDTLIRLFPRGVDADLPVERKANPYGPVWMHRMWEEARPAITKATEEEAKRKREADDE